jgi:excinuclease ABC subunit C
MECFDISNVSSNHIVASMVRFTNGNPDNQNYRRYRIRTVTGQDDFASMAEVVFRRYSRILRENIDPDQEHSQEPLIEHQRRLAREGKANIVLPDLVIVDGGKGQLSSAFKQLRSLGLQELPIIGLAKQHEEVFFPGESAPLLIPHDRGALKILQRIRDEAHRFANGYNELLYRKRMKESALDDCPGMSPRRKLLLLEKFGSLARISKATPSAIAQIPGISEKFATTLLAFLSKA